MINNIKLLAVIALIAAASSCQMGGYKYESRIELGDVTPLGIAIDQDVLWVSDGDHNQVVSYTLTGNKLSEKDGFERPMHIDAHDGKVFIPEYGNDQLLSFHNDRFDTLRVDMALDAPAGVSVMGSEIAIADFYNHRIVYFDGSKWQAYGEEGNAPKQFYYPTDVQLYGDNIYIADAYNNRIQVFTKNGDLLSVIGEEDDMNASTGIFVNEAGIYITDFENDRVLIYDHNGKRKQILEEQVTKPTDVAVAEDKLYIANYSGNTIAVYKVK